MGALIEASEQLEQLLGRPPLIRCNGKAALDRGWPTGPFDEPDTWRARLDGHGQNVGMVTGHGLVVVDADLYKPSGEDSLDALLADTGLSRDTVVAVTGGGGRHLLYTYDTALTVPCRALGPEGYPAVETKGDGGYIVVEPSVHPDTGRPYQWEASSAPGDVAVAPATEAFLQLVGALPGGESRRWSRWRPIEEGDELHPDDIEAARLLCEHFGGHDPVQGVDLTVGVLRPGKERGTASATVGYIGPGVAKIWTDGWPPFTAGSVVDLGELRRRAGVARRVDLSGVAVQLPDGYRLWTPEDEQELPAPVLHRDAYHGPVGAYLDLIDGQTEAHPAAVGFQLLTCFGTLIGRRARYFAEPIVHHCNLFGTIVGPSSTGAKGIADGVAFALVEKVEPNFQRVHGWGGLGSGEVMVRELADRDDGVPVEKRRAVLDAELSSVLRVIRREGSTLGDNLRKAFDYGPLRHGSLAHKSVVAVGHHIAVVGSITPDELRVLVDDLAIANGLANRFLLIWSQIAGHLPFGGHIDGPDMDAIAAEILDAFETLDGRLQVGGGVTLQLTEAARDVWESFYRARRTGLGDGILRSLTARQVAHAARLSVVYAVLGGSDVIDVKHLAAARAWCDYSAETAARVFGDGMFGKRAQVLDAIRNAGEMGVTGTALHRGLGHNWPKGALIEARDALVADALVHVHRASDRGRPRELHFAIWPEQGVDSHISFLRGEGTGVER